ncbi:unnamed protein product [Ambrosiozyma monospora]|uniref:Unnamed protein product n=1 Tax=Ambrosiozyma monospora TaxID=43982 RepID=A0ACB5SXP8_AMBMO|nr:unnamed protein product [Ambrosiozyma monospora]
MEDFSDFNDHLDDLIHLSNDVSGCNCFHGKLNLSITIAISFNWLRSSRLIIKKFQDLLLAGNVISVIIDFLEDTDENDLKIFETLNQMPFLRTLKIVSGIGRGDANEMHTPTVIIPNPNIVNIAMGHSPFMLKFSFPNQLSKLSRLSIKYSSLSPFNFELKLRNLSIVGVSDHGIMPTFTSIEQLFDLEEVSLDSKQMENFILRIPVNSLTAVSKEIMGDAAYDPNGLCYSDKLTKFDRFTKLASLKFDCVCDPSISTSENYLTKYMNHFDSSVILFSQIWRTSEHSKLEQEHYILWI